MTRILVADEQEVVRSGLRHILEQQPDFEVVGEAADGREAITLALSAVPHVVILDLTMPVCNGLEATREIRTRSPQIEVLIFTMQDDREVIGDAIAAGAHGLLMKSDPTHHLIAALRALGRHEAYVSGRLSKALLETLVAQGRSPRISLTSRERAVIHLIAEGSTNKIIGSKLGISPKTVESHRTAAIRKLGLRNTADLVRYAVRTRMVRA
jgi:DNA-binding NarL/FixJ family response regulator